MFSVLTRKISTKLILTLDREHLIKGGVNELDINLIALFLVNNQSIW
jgi:hypothetical protein